MTPHHILVVVIRLLAILWLLHLATLIAPTAVTVDQSDGLFATLWTPLAVQFLACVWLWLFPATLASKLLRPGSSQVAGPAASFAEWRNLSLIAVGVFVLASAIPDAIYWLVVVVGSFNAATEDALNLEQKANVLATVAEIVVGLWLVIGANGIASLISRLRTAGLPVQGPPT